MIAYIDLYALGIGLIFAGLIIFSALLGYHIGKKDNET